MRLSIGLRTLFSTKDFDHAIFAYTETCWGCKGLRSLSLRAVSRLSFRTTQIGWPKLRQPSLTDDSLMADRRLSWINLKLNQWYFIICWQVRNARKQWERKWPYIEDFISLRLHSASISTRQEIITCSKEIENVSARRKEQMLQMNLKIIFVENNLVNLRTIWAMRGSECTQVI